MSRVVTVVYFVRHGSHGALHDRLCGRSAGVSLSAVGRREAERLGEHFKGFGIQAVFASPLERTVETGEPIAAACGVPLTVAPSLLEIDFGGWNGRSFAELALDPDWARWNADRDQIRPPDGETMLELQQRLQHWLATLVGSETQAVVAVSHADVIRSAVCLVLGLSTRFFDRFEIAPASISTLRAEAWGLRLLSLNGALR